MPTFHENIKFVLMSAQIFGLLPVQGITAKKIKDLTFVWRNKRVIFSLAIIIGSCFNTFMSFYRICKTGYNMYRLSNFMFNANSVVVEILFFVLAKNWPKMMQKWNLIESTVEKWNGNKILKRKFLTVLVTIMSAAAIEHFLSIFHTISHINNEDKPNKFETYFRESYSHIFDFFEFSPFLAVFAVVMNVCNVFAWNFLDAFVIIISIALTQKFKKITQRVKNAFITKNSLKLNGTKLREDYNKISFLCKIVNKKISMHIIVSFATNMFFIITQLYWSINSSHSKTIVDDIYYTFSFSLLVLRTVAVVLFASSIKEECMKCMDCLLSLNSEDYSIEIERLIYQIYFQSVALTGHDFFTITKSLLLAMAGSIVTYELFLVQSSNAISYPFN